LSINAVRLLAQATMATLDGLMQGDAMSSENKMLDKAWRGVEAMHLYIETHKLLYARKVPPPFPVLTGQVSSLPPY